MIPKGIPLNEHLHALVTEQFNYHQAIGGLRRFSLLFQEHQMEPMHLAGVVQALVRETLTPQQRQAYRRIGEAMEVEEQKRGKRG